MELDKLRELMAKSQQKNQAIVSSRQSSQAIQKILHILKAEMLILGFFAGACLVFNRILTQPSQRFFMFYFFGLSLILILFLAYFYSKIKKQNRIDASLREVLENQIKNIKIFIKMYYLSTFFVLSISLIISVLILGFLDNKFLNLQFFWKQIALVFCVVLGVTLWIVKWWLSKFYQKPLIELEKTLAELDT